MLRSSRVGALHLFVSGATPFGAREQFTQDRADDLLSLAQGLERGRERLESSVPLRVPNLHHADSASVSAPRMRMVAKAEKDTPTVWSNARAAMPAETSCSAASRHSPAGCLHRGSRIFAAILARIAGRRRRSAGGPLSAGSLRSAGPHPVGVGETFPTRPAGYHRDGAEVDELAQGPVDGVC